VLDRPSQQVQILMGVLAPGIGDRNNVTGKILTAVVGGGMAGRLFGRLRDDAGLAYALGMMHLSRRSPNAFIAYLATSDETTERAESTMREALDRFRLEGPSETEVARAKAYVLGNVAMDQRTNARHARYLAFFELIGLGWEYPQRYARALEVTAQDVACVARHSLERASIVMLRSRP
jgi:zinc protease